MSTSFSRWPGAWERHLARRHRNPFYFPATDAVTVGELQEAQTRDQEELAQFNISLQSLIARCTALDDQTGIDTITDLKNDLDECQITAFGLGADLTEQISAITAINEVVTMTLQENNEAMRVRLIQNEGQRLVKLSSLAYPVVCDLQRTVCPIPEDQLASALLCEQELAFKAALGVLSTERKACVAARIDTIANTLISAHAIEQANGKLAFLLKQLPAATIHPAEPV